MAAAMRADPARLSALMAARRMDDADVARGMRRHGLPGARPHWVSCARRGVWADYPDRWVAVLAVVLGVGAAELTPRLTLVVDNRDLHR